MEFLSGTRRQIVVGRMRLVNDLIGEGNVSFLRFEPKLGHSIMILHFGQTCFRMKEQNIW